MATMRTLSLRVSISSLHLRTVRLRRSAIEVGNFTAFNFILKSLIPNMETISSGTLPQQAIAKGTGLLILLLSRQWMGSKRELVTSMSCVLSVEGLTQQLLRFLFTRL